MLATSWFIQSLLLPLGAVFSLPDRADTSVRAPVAARAAHQ